MNDFSFSSASGRCRVIQALSDHYDTVQDIVSASGVSVSYVQKLLGELEDEGRVSAADLGGRGGGKRWILK